VENSIENENEIHEVHTSILVITYGRSHAIQK